MEGPLSKWTNLMKGWQFRWFVLDSHSGLLSYYTSKDKRLRGEKRGCIRLLGAVIGIDDEDDSTFTITVEQKTFHFQAKNSDEKETWINALESSIINVAHPKIQSGLTSGHNMNDFDKKLAESDAYLKILIEQIAELQLKIDNTVDETLKEQLCSIKDSTEVLIENIKQSIVFLQISKHMIKEKFDRPYTEMKISLIAQNSKQQDKGDFVANHLTSTQNDVMTRRSAENLTINQQFPATNKNDFELPLTNNFRNSLPNLATPSEDFENGSKNLYIKNEANFNVSYVSYSSSEEDDHFYDAEEGSNNLEKCKFPSKLSSLDGQNADLYDGEDEDETPESMANHGNLLSHLLSQVHIGMDLTKVVLPTFILEKRSLLEMYCDFLAHPDLFVQIVDQPGPRERLTQVVKWYLSAFHAGRKTPVAKKPYNPILGECFICYYQLPYNLENKDLVIDGPVPWCTKQNLSFIAEQVSHHPPISAFYAECFDKRISINGYIWTKSKFLGLSVGVHMIGQAVISLLDHDEEYIVTFPNGYGRSILTIPWMELGGKVTINCVKTGYNATIEFHTKPFYGGKKDQITAELYSPNEKKSYCTIKGEWNGVMTSKYSHSTHTDVFLDTNTLPILKKQVKPIDEQEAHESRRLWRHVTLNLKLKDIEKATEAKFQLEQKQREEAKNRKELDLKYETKLFHEVGEHWVFDNPLVKRIQDQLKI